MKRLITIITLLACFAVAKGQQTYFTPGVPPSSNPFSPTFRVKTTGTDSLNDLYFSIGSKWYQIYTAPQSWSYFSRRFKGSGKTTSDKVDIAIGDSSATTLNNFAVFRNANGDLVLPNINFAAGTNTVIFNGIKINANGGLQTNAPFASGAGSFLKQNASTGLVEKDTVHYLKTSDLVNIYNSDGTIDTNRSVDLGTHTLSVGGTVISGASSLNTTLNFGNDGTLLIGAGDLTRGHTALTKYSSTSLLQAYQDNYAGAVFDTLRMDADGFSAHYNYFGQQVGLDWGNGISGVRITDHSSQIGGVNAADYSANIKTNPYALVQTNMLNARADSAANNARNIYNHSDSLKADRDVNLKLHTLLFHGQSATDSLAVQMDHALGLQADTYDKTHNTEGYFQAFKNGNDFAFIDSIGGKAEVIVQWRYGFNNSEARIAAYTPGTAGTYVAINSNVTGNLRGVVIADSIYQRGASYKSYRDYFNSDSLTLMPKQYNDAHYAPISGGGYVPSVFGRTGAILAVSGDYNTSQVTENTNLYFTNARVLTTPLTGFVSGAGTASSSDNVLQAFQKINGNEVVDAANIATNTSNISTNTANISTNTTAITTKLAKTDTATIVQTISAGVIRLGTTSAMQSYSGEAVSVIVVATDGTGGTFNYVSSGLTNDGGVVFTATGKGSGYWQRQFDASKGVSVGWWGTNTAAIQSASNYAGTKGIVNLTPGYSYSQTDRILLGYDGQIWNMNKATLQRQTETVATISGTVLSSASSFTVSSVPSTWHIGDVIQLFVSQSAIGASPTLSINNIVGNVISISGTVGAALYNSAGSYASPSVWKVWNQFDDVNNYNFEIRDGVFDGNSSTSAANVYWGVNQAVNAAVTNSLITGCSFINMPSNAIYGQGFKIIDNYFHNINDAAIHLSADYTHVPALYPFIIDGNRMIRCNQVLSSTGSNHSEGVITFSFTSGYGRIHHNWVDSSLNSFVGTIQMASSTLSGATRFLTVDDNTVRDVSLGPIAGFSADVTEIIKPGKIIFADNIFDNCGSTSPFPATLSATWAFIDPIYWVHNMPVGGTVVTIPAEVYAPDVIANVGSSGNIQTGTSINIDGNITNGGNLSVAGTSVQNGNAVIGTSGQANTAISLGVRKIITGGTTAYGLYQDGVIQSGVTAGANMSYSSPSTIAASFTLPILRHYYANGVTIGSGSSITNQYGFVAGSTLTGATNNFGFYSDISAGSGRWGFFENGSANNAFAGKTFIGPSIATPDAYLKLGAGTATAGTAPLKFAVGVNLTTPESGALEYDGNYLSLTNSAVKRSTLDATYASADLIAQSAAGNITTFTVGAATATFNISAYLNVTAISTDIIQVQVTYTDENSTSQTVSYTTLNSISDSNYNPVTIRAKTATVITVKTNLTLGGGSVTYDAGARITQF